MAEALDPSGGAVRVGNVTLSTRGLAGTAESYLPDSAGMRGAELPTGDFDEALAEEGLRAQETVVLSDTYEVRAPGAGTRTNGFGEPILDVVVPDAGSGWGQVLLAVDESGVMTWNFSVSPPTTRMREQATRRYLVRGTTPPAAEPARAGATRGLIGAVGHKVLKVLAFKLIDVVAGEVGERFAERWEEKRRPYRMRTFLPTDYASPNGAALDGDGWSRLTGGPALLFVHGTFSRTHSAFGRLSPEIVAELRARYGGRVFAFDHFTLSHDPRQNIERFIQTVPDDVHLDLDIVCHSRGGLVSRELAERQSDIAMGSRRIAVRKVVFVGVPNAGTILADADHLGHLVDSYTNVLNFLPDTGVVEVIQTVIAVVKQLAVGAGKGLVGLQAMAPGGAFLTGLNAATPTRPAYLALSSNYEPSSAGFRQYVVDRLVDGLFKADNDLVVPTGGVYESNGSSLFPIADHEVLRGADAVAHLRYFESARTQQRLRDWLTA
jgi:hypothetical protein